MNGGLYGHIKQSDGKDRRIQTEDAAGKENNQDPNVGNWLVDPAWNLILIDHTRAFAPGKNLVHKLNRVDKALWEKMLALDLPPLKAVLDRHLDGGQVKDILGRRDKMKQEIDKMVAARGEADVFFQ